MYFEDWSVFSLLALLGQILALYLSATCQENQELNLPLRILYGFFAFVFGWFYVLFYIFFFYGRCKKTTRTGRKKTTSRGGNQFKRRSFRSKEV